MVEVTDDGVYSSVEEDRGVFGVSCVGSGGGGDVTSLVGVEWDDNGWGIIDTGEENGVDAAVVIGRMCKKVCADGVGFEVNIWMGGIM